MKNLDIYEDQINVGQVKVISTKNIVNYVEMLFSPTTKAQFYYDEENDVVQIKLSDTDLQISDLACVMDKSTLHDLIVNLKTVYGQLGKKENTN